MAVVHPFLANPAKQMLIGGRWVDALSRRVFQTVNPATGAVLATLPAAGPEDVDLAVANARQAFEGPWRGFLPADRQRVLLRLAELVEQRWEELARLDTLDMGAPIRHTRAPRDLLAGLLRFYAGQALALDGRTIQTLSLIHI